MTTSWRGLAGVLVLLVVLAGSAPSVSADAGAGGRGRERTARADGFYWGVEIRRGGPAPCERSTPQPCFGFVWGWVCPLGGVGRVTEVASYLGADRPQFVGVTLRARIALRGQPSVEPWVTRTQSIPPSTVFRQRLLRPQNVSDSVPTRVPWDLIVQMRWDRSNAADVVRTFREPLNWNCG